MKITDVDLFQIHPRNQARNRGNFPFYGQLSRIAVYRVATDCGLVGCGETRGPVPPRSEVESVEGKGSRKICPSGIAGMKYSTAHSRP